MNNLYKLLSTGVIVVFFIGSSLATADDDTGFYLGGGIARSDTEFRGLGSGNDFDESDNTPALRLGYMFSSRWGIDGTIIGLDTENDRGLKADAGIFAVSFIGTIPLADIVDLYGKAGAAQIRSELELPNGRELRDESDTEFFWAAGAELDLGHHNFFLEYNRFDAEDLNLNTAILGYKYQF